MIKFINSNPYFKYMKIPVLSSTIYFTCIQWWDILQQHSCNKVTVDHLQSPLESYFAIVNQNWKTQDENVASKWS